MCGVSHRTGFESSWVHVAAGTQAEGRAELLGVIEQLQGLEVAAGKWERHVLPARVAGYDPRWLDELCLAGEVTWARLTPPPEPASAVDGRSGPGGSSPGRRGSSTPSPATPLAITARPELPWMLAAVRTEPTGNEPTRGTLGGHPGRAAITRGVLPFGNWQPRRDGCPPRSTEGLWDLVARGIVTADAFSAVRSLHSSRGRRPSGLRRVPGRRSPLGPRRAVAGSGIGEGRWSLVPEPDDASSGSSTAPAAEELAEAVAGQMRVRWGVVAWDLWSHESYRVPWRDVVRALRRFEARGQAPLGGRFVAGVTGEQYALPEAASLLADVRRDLDRGADVVVAGADPSITPAS